MRFSQFDAWLASEHEGDLRALADYREDLIFLGEGAEPDDASASSGEAA